MKNQKLLATLVVALCASPLTHAAETCSDTEAVFACMSRIEAASESPGAQEQAAAVQVQAETQKTKAAVDDRLASALTGANSGGTATASTLNDLAPLFDALGLLSSGGNDSGTLTLNLNALIPVQAAENNNTQLQLIVNTQPKPLDELVNAFPEAVRSERKDALQKDISTFGDAQLSLTWSLVNRRFGRDFSVLRPLLAPMYDGAAARGRTSGSHAKLLMMQHLMDGLTGEQQVALRTTAIKDLQIPKSQKDKIVQQALDASEELITGRQSIEAEVARFSGLVELVQQQPQLLFSLSHDIRDELVGPEKTSASVTWEMTRRNLSAFINGDGVACKTKAVGAGTAEYDRCANALQNYLGSGSADLTKQWRFKLTASYQRVKSVTYNYPSDGFSLTLPDTDRWEVALATGRPLNGAAGNDRIDLEVAYDSNVNNDTTNKERVKASLTYTRHMGNVDVPFSLVYANRSEFLGDVDHQISMHFGVKFRQAK